MQAPQLLILSLPDDGPATCVGLTVTSGKDTVPLKTQCSLLALWGPGKNTKVQMQAQLQGGNQAGAHLPSPLLEQGPAEKWL